MVDTFWHYLHQIVPWWPRIDPKCLGLLLFLVASHACYRQISRGRIYFLSAVTLRLKLLINLAISNNVLTPGQPLLALIPQCKWSSRAARRVPFFLNHSYDTRVWSPNLPHSGEMRLPPRLLSKLDHRHLTSLLVTIRVKLVHDNPQSPWSVTQCQSMDHVSHIGHLDPLKNSMFSSLGYCELWAQCWQ